MKIMSEALTPARIMMGMILHDWNLEKKMHLVKAAYNVLPAGGAFVAIENMIDDARRGQPARRLRMSSPHTSETAITLHAPRFRRPQSRVRHFTLLFFPFPFPS
jgi:hypothetical protein